MSEITNETESVSAFLKLYSKLTFKPSLQTDKRVIGDWGCAFNEQENISINKNIVITGHDAYYKKKGNINDINAYKNSINFVNTVSMARKYESSHQKLIIIAGACQSDYEELIKAGANFASSPKRINIHALDPAIIASSIAFSDKNQSIDLIKLIEKTKYGSDGIGGIITNGTMYVGFPR